MPEVIRVPAGQHFGPTPVIRPLFDNVGIAGYFTVPNEIPPLLFEQQVPPRNYTLVVDKEVPRARLKHQQLRPPTIAETLWAIGFMNLELSGVISQQPVRFMHEPFRAYIQATVHADALRQIVARRSGVGFAIETVPVRTPVKDIHLAYVIA